MAQFPLDHTVHHGQLRSSDCPRERVYATPPSLPPSLRKMMHAAPQSESRDLKRVFGAVLKLLNCKEAEANNGRRNAHARGAHFDSRVFFPHSLILSLPFILSYLFEIGGAAAAADVDGLSLLRNELFFSKGILAPSSRSSLPLANLSFFGHSQTLTFNSSSSFALPT